MTVFLLSERIAFPPPTLAEKDGLLAVGGDLSQSRLLLAYRLGIFPWFSEGDPILWWSPDPRLVLYPKDIKISKSLMKVIRKGLFRISMDTAFEKVIRECAKVHRKQDEGTWINDQMIEAYCRLHESGYAHSVEAWLGQELVGGLYGVSLGKCFFGESMFTQVSNASKVSLAVLSGYLITKNFDFIDCQLATEHLSRLGAKEIPKKSFLRQLRDALDAPTLRGKWNYHRQTDIKRH